MSQTYVVSVAELEGHIQAVITQHLGEFQPRSLWGILEAGLDHLLRPGTDTMTMGDMLVRSGVDRDFVGDLVFTLFQRIQWALERTLGVISAGTRYSYVREHGDRLKIIVGIPTLPETFPSYEEVLDTVEGEDGSHYPERIRRQWGLA